ncbi:haloacid dehalogenase [Tateyamaria omphalii]|uniref:HAD-IIA family hydrolase n=1 Tax=Tateyamaria omphalii TaxID=299262 RepID=UPI001672E530|nr:HAD-IIA family hydrolase [Tateyamaria omphalii]GGX43020.1 haloacid dehalogenase [Tateyamaria omphalii]
MSYENTLSTEGAFQRYEEVRSRFPTAEFADRSKDCSGLTDIADQFDAFLLDSFGVLNVGDRPIPGATQCIARLRDAGKRLIILTNAASYTRDDAVERYHRLGFDFNKEEVVSSRDVTIQRLAQIAPSGRWGAVATPEDCFADIDADIRHWDGDDVDALVFLSSAVLSPDLFAKLEKALRNKPIPVVVANPDLVAPRENGLSKEPGYYAHLLADRLGLLPTFYGKPFGDAFDDAAARLEGVKPERIAMVGDTLHTDILGGRAFGAKTILVREHGLFAGTDVSAFVRRSQIIPDFQCDSI